MEIGSRAVSMAACCAFLMVVACGGKTDEQSSDSTDLRRALDSLRATNAVLHARLAVAQENEPYLVLDIPERELRLEFCGLVLNRSEIRGVKFNRRARRISRDTTRVGFCRIPFRLRDEGWYEDATTLALKDSTVVMSRPDTTGRVAEQIQKARVLALLRFDRELVVALHGQYRPTSLPGHLKAWLAGALRPLLPGSGLWQLRTMKREAILVELKMDPGLVRSFAPNLEDETQLVLRF